MSVGYRSQYFREGDTHEWRAELAPTVLSSGVKRHGDTDKFKVFELHMKSVGERGAARGVTPETSAKKMTRPMPPP